MSGIKTPEQVLEEDILRFLEVVIPNNMLFRPFRKRLEWAAKEVVGMSKKYVESKEYTTSSRK